MFRSLFFVLGFFFSLNALAESLVRPPAFTTKASETVTFVDFISAHYDISFRLNKSDALVKTSIVFRSFEKGRPVFDLVPGILEAKLDGVAVDIAELSPPGDDTKVRVAMKDIEPGLHQLEIVHAHAQNVLVEASQFESAFWVSDLSDRNYIEKYLPTNLEYDQYAMTMTIDATKSRAEQRVFANGKVSSQGFNKWSIVFPSTFTSSSVFLHVVPYANVQTLTYKRTQRDGSLLPVTIYSKIPEVLSYFKYRTDLALDELDRRFGSWLHPEVLIYATDTGGGMEYAGATITTLNALSHELAHNYFGRALIPANGNAGWIDEALASWRDSNYPSVAKPSYDRATMASYSLYRRHTDADAYGKGAEFMAYLNFKMKARGGLEEFLRGFLKSHVFKPITTKDFQNAAEDFLGESLQKDFETWVYAPLKWSDETNFLKFNPDLHALHPH